MDIGKFKIMFVGGRYCSLIWRGLIPKIYLLLQKR